MFDTPRSNIQVTLDIPSNTVISAAQHVFEGYLPIVESAVKETQTKLLYDEEFQEHVKEYVKKTIERVIKEAIDSTVESVIEQSCRGVIKERVKDSVASLCNLKKYEIL